LKFGLTEGLKLIAGATQAESGAIIAAKCPMETVVYMLMLADLGIIKANSK